MAVSVDTVYKTVLLILNKEQRGYMTPDEFNKIGSQVQREIFERYFEDLNQNVRVIQTDFDYANRVYNTDEKIAEFKTVLNLNSSGSNNTFEMPADLYRLNSLTYDNQADEKELTRLNRNEYYSIALSKLTKPTKTNPIFLYEDNKAFVYPSSIIGAPSASGPINAQYVKKPDDIRWGYTVGALGQYIYTDYPYVATSINRGTIIPSVNTVALATDQLYDNATYTTSSTGTGAEFSVSVNGGVVTNVTVTAQGSGYSAGDTFNFPVLQFGGAAVGDLSLELSSTNLFSNSQQGYIDFELHNSERTEIVLNVLLYAGLVIRDPAIIQSAMSQIQKDEVNEKQ